MKSPPPSYNFPYILKLFNPLKTKRKQLYLKIQSVPRCKHFVSVIKTIQLMLYTEVVAVCYDNHIKHITALFQARSYG